MSRRIGRVVSDLSRGNYHTATKEHGFDHQSTSNNDKGSAAGKPKLKLIKLSLLLSGLAAWRRSDDNGTGGAAKSSNGAGKRRGRDVGQVVRKCVSIVEQLFTSYSGGRRREKDRPELRRRPHTFTSRRDGGSAAPSKRHYKRRLSSAPASLRGSPASSGHLAVGESVKVSTSSEVSTMEELQSAVQAAIAHCKNSIAVAEQAAGGDKQCKC